jgi:hypothetical protein
MVRPVTTLYFYEKEDQRVVSEIYGCLIDKNFPNIEKCSCTESDITLSLLIYDKTGGINHLVGKESILNYLKMEGGE